MFLPHLIAQAEAGRRLVTLTCYDASMAHVLAEAGVDILLVGDSLGMTVQGHATTLAVTLEQMIYHTGAVARGAAGRSFVLADLPFGSYQESPGQAFASSARLMAAGANGVKLEGGVLFAGTVRFLAERGIPVCAHLGLLPQSVNATGYRMQAKAEAEAAQLIDDARALQDAGASLVLLESIPSALAARVTDALKAPTIGIGAGPHCDGQVLVLNDLLGLTPKPPRFARNFMPGAGSIAEAVCRYAEAVREGSFPGPAESF